ncbi:MULTISPECIES: thioredoxin family protein [unclassified Campylobacter]|uniref:thioredoxin family protein n=1 Tax=unclassified Campylobacter TaxID=2593542 RepID=UPI001BDA20BE|nr:MULTISPECIES: thioredoxin family protein [unclassified Campylobacter]MBZ7978618.1 thioredoxin family protein [Campylobacter sp. RM12654]MBZ7982400.1 thioredoxin family protein [Campylobacter sp. RM12640]MBZ7984252.1 thioredoxin family protein [Campylobacter sp. RM12647]MBZ7989582.1 thioredoxin family protein [Campylobacter sp. RM12635]MBZ7991822.1 thioredoxin family protein [Campylobacter sp. RM9331]MBZ7993621.1 thioredoxin family protein [Campylobacter sp. RM9333]MBZ8006103.1 thioredoxin
MKTKVFFAILIAAFGIWYYYYNEGSYTKTDGFELTYIDNSIIKNYNSNILLNFCNTSNSSCNQFQPILKSVYNELGNLNVKILNIDIFDNPELLNKFPISLIPIQFFYTKDGVNFKPKSEIGKKFKEVNFNDETFYYHLGILTQEEIMLIFEEMQNY